MIFKNAMVVALAAGLLAVSCGNPFTTREPEPPDAGSSNFLDTSTIENVFKNLENSFRGRNVEVYIRSFVDTTRSQRRFEFEPDPGVAGSRPGTFIGWAIQQERQYFSSMLQATTPDSVLNLVMTGPFPEIRSESATATRDYVIIVNHSSQSGGPRGEFTGQARFFLERDEFGDWSIYRWEDTKTGQDQPSWSELKAFFH